LTNGIIGYIIITDGENEDMFCLDSRSAEANYFAKTYICIKKYCINVLTNDNLSNIINQNINILYNLY